MFMFYKFKFIEKYCHHIFKKTLHYELLQCPCLSYVLQIQAYLKIFKTVKPVDKDHLREPPKAVKMDKWACYVLPSIAYYTMCPKFSLYKVIPLGICSNLNNLTNDSLRWFL